MLLQLFEVFVLTLVWLCLAGWWWWVESMESMALSNWYAGCCRRLSVSPLKDGQVDGNVNRTL